MKILRLTVEDSHVLLQCCSSSGACRRRYAYSCILRRGFKGAQPAAGNTKLHSRKYKKRERLRGTDSPLYGLPRIQNFLYLCSLDGLSAWWSVDHLDHHVATPLGTAAVRQYLAPLFVVSSSLMLGGSLLEHLPFGLRRWRRVTRPLIWHGACPSSTGSSNFLI